MHLPRTTRPLSVAPAAPTADPLARTSVSWGRVSAQSRSRFLLAYFPPPPLRDASQVLYIGPGTFWWTRELRRRAQAEVLVLGTAEDPQLSASERVAGSLLEGFDCPAASFDAVQLVLCLASLPYTCVPGALEEARRLTKPGGFLQVIEPGWGYGGRATIFLAAWQRQVLWAEGITLGVAYHLERLLQAAGWQEVEGTRLDLPLGGGPIGELTASLASSAIEAQLHPRLATLGVSEMSYFHVCWAAQVEWSGPQEGLGDRARPMQPYFGAIGRNAARTRRRADR